MIYPAYVHLGDKKYAHGVTFPDFEGCYSAADEFSDIKRNAQEAVELHFEDEDFALPAPSDIADLEATGEYEGGIWMLIDIDVSKLNSKAVRLNVSLPSHIVTRMDEFAKGNRLTRSGLIVKAAEQYMDQAEEG